MRKVNIPIFVPHRGCMHDCVFCNQKRITGQVGDVTPETAALTIEESLQTIGADTQAEAAFFGGSFTAIPRAEQEAFLRAAQPYVKSGRLTGIRLSTRPDCISRENLAMLASYGVTSIELGVQSTDETVLLKSRRGHTAADTARAVALIREYDFELGLQMMLGLPGDTRTKAMQTAADIVSLSPDTARIYPTLVIRDSRLCDLYEAGRYTPLTLTEAVEQSAQIYTMFTQHGIRVLRMGLMASEDMCKAALSWQDRFIRLLASWYMRGCFWTRYARPCAVFPVRRLYCASTRRICQRRPETASETLRRLKMNRV